MSEERTMIPVSVCRTIVDRVNGANGERVPGFDMDLLMSNIEPEHTTDQVWEWYYDFGIVVLTVTLTLTPNDNKEMYEFLFEIRGHPQLRVEHWIRFEPDTGKAIQLMRYAPGLPDPNEIRGFYGILENWKKARGHLGELEGLTEL